MGDESKLQHRGTMAGTPYYMPPETLKISASGPFTDLWSLGVLAYKLLVGDVPFNGKSKHEVQEKIKNVQYSFPKGVDKQAKDLISKLLVGNPLERLGYQEDSGY